MPRPRRSTSALAALRRVAPLVVVCLAACSGGSPSSPPPPAAVLQVGGEWLGVEEVLGAEPVGNCYADWFNSLAGTLSDYRLVIVQNGASVRLTSTFIGPGPGNGLSETFEGTVGASSLEATVISGPRVGPFDCDGTPITVRTTAERFNLAGTSQQLSGVLTIDFELLDPQTGARLGTVRLREGAEFRR